MKLPLRLLAVCAFIALMHTAHAQSNDVRLFNVSPRTFNGYDFSGFVFSMNPDGSDSRIHKTFSPNADGTMPNVLLKASDGKCYGLTRLGGSKNGGVVFRINADGTGYTRLADLEATLGYDPSALIEGSDGVLYGQTQDALFALNKDGSNLRLIFKFTKTQPSATGFFPSGQLIEASDGKLYGNTVFGGANNSGTIYRIGRDGSNFQKLLDLDATNTGNFHLKEGSDGKLYGIGGSPARMVRLSKDGTGYETLYEFTFNGRSQFAFRPGNSIVATFTHDSAGELIRINTDGTGYQSLYTFTSSPMNFTVGSNGKLYGISNDGGAGIVFRIDADGNNYTVLRSNGDFAGGIADNVYSKQHVIESSPGNFMVAAVNGGTGGNGAIFTIDDAGNHSLKKDYPQPDGGIPSGKLLLASDGLLYGTTETGGAVGRGTIFKIGKDGQGFAVIHHFTDIQAGNGPRSEFLRTGLIEIAGQLYGARRDGIFRIDRNGSNYTIVHTNEFPGGTQPLGSLVYNSVDGKIYGIKSADNAGYIYKMNPNGSDYTILHNLATTSATTGNSPQNIGQLANGDLIVCTSRGASNSAGATFLIKTDGSDIRVLRTNTFADFVGASGALPVEGSDGLLYGSVFFGSAVFSIKKDATGYTPYNEFAGFQVMGTLTEISGKRLVGWGWTLVNFNMETKVLATSSPGNAGVSRAGLTAVPKTAQTVTLDNLPSKKVGDAPFAPVASASSGLPIEFRSSNADLAVIENGQVVIKAAGTVTISAYQAGNITVGDAIASKELVIGKGTQTITFNALPPKVATDAPFQLTATATSGLPVTFTSSNPDIVSVAGTLATIHKAGEVTITASQSSPNYEPTTPVSVVLTVTKASQSIVFEPLSNKTYGDGPVQLVATTSSGLVVSFTSSNPVVATVEGSVVSIVGAGSATITAGQSGNEVYAPAPAVAQSFTVAKGTQSVTFSQPADQTMGGSPLVLQATATSGLAVQFSSSSDKVSITGSTAAILKPGRVEITAAQPGNDNFSSAASVSRSFCIKPSKPIITVGGSPSNPVLTSSADAGNQWFFDAAPIVGATNKTFTVVSDGVYTVKAKVDDCESQISAATSVAIVGMAEATNRVFAVYPNPATQDLYVEVSGTSGSNAEIDVIDATGRVVVSALMAGTGTHLFDVRPLHRGIYIIRVNMEERVVIRKFEKQ